MKDNLTVEAVFAHFQDWANKTLVGLPGSGHWAIDRYGGFCPPYLGKDFGYGFGGLPAQPPDVIDPGMAGPSGFVPFVIQQIKEEIAGLVTALMCDYPDLTDSILEIGLGDYGGTHVLFSQVFDTVVTVESNGSLIRRFLGTGGAGPGSHFVNKRSADVSAADLPIGSFGVLFIDGDHALAREDHEKFEPLVRPGGLVCFHDTRYQDLISAQYVNSLRGQLDIIDIWHPEGVAAGISYYIKK